MSLIQLTKEQVKQDKKPKLIKRRMQPKRYELQKLIVLLHGAGHE